MLSEAGGNEISNLTIVPGEVTVAISVTFKVSLRSHVHVFACFNDTDHSRVVNLVG
jgi:hypothetical protein